jgi:hypothetical protein
MSMQTAVQEINADYDAKMEAEKSSVAYDNMEISGGRAVWKDVLAVYAVKTNTDTDNPQEVATMDESKKQILSDIFWEMNSISSRSESHSETEITETDDGNATSSDGNDSHKNNALYHVSHLTVDEMADCTALSRTAGVSCRASQGQKQFPLGGGTLRYPIQ